MKNAKVQEESMASRRITTVTVVAMSSINKAYQLAEFVWVWKVGKI